MRMTGVGGLLVLGVVFAAPSSLRAQDLVRRPAQESARMPLTVRWGMQRPDLMRFNRVEGLSVGIRGQIRPRTRLGPLSLTATGRLGYGDLEPNARLDIVSETIERRLTFSVFRELAAVDEDARHLGLGNSLLAAIAGRDDGDYYRRSGVSLEWTPPQSERRDLRVRGFAEYQRGAASAIDHALFKLGNDAFRFREGLVADKGWLYGGQIELTPWWGSDPNLVQGGLEFRAEAATGDFEYARGMLVARLAVPLPADIHLGIEAGAGTSRGGVTMQRLWHVGGPSSLRGYDPRRLTGTSFGRARGELARAFSFGALSLFSDVGWAGEYESYRFEDALYSAGAGLAIVDGLIRLDAAWGLRKPRTFRLDLYLDAIL
jgi:hypothetical protein